ncbi:MAG TPA: hypothetical protein VJH03_06570 [Blastocatellia bacterium]|nr:hypothetical protein [Blastocatellia bacterium]
MQGSFDASEVVIRQLSNLEELLPTRGSVCIPVNKGRLEEAAKHRLVRAAMRNAGHHRRFLEGLRIIVDGLKQYHGESRLHQFVRALEGLILPETGKTKRQFASRCQTFTIGSSGDEKILNEAFDMRCDVEHVHKWDRSLNNYPDQEIESVALLRTRQMESLACSAYSCVLSNPSLQRHFVADADIEAFWKLPEADRRILWPPGLDLQSIR